MSTLIASLKQKPEFLGHLAMANGNEVQYLHVWLVYLSLLGILALHARAHTDIYIYSRCICDYEYVNMCLSLSI